MCAQRWRAIGESFLYRSVSICTSDSFYVFAQTIFSRPILAFHVRTLSLKNWYDPVLGPDDRQLWFDDLKNNDKCTKTARDQLGEWDSDDLPARTLRVLLAHLPSLTSYTTDSSFQHFILRRGLERAAHPFFTEVRPWSRLTHLHLSNAAGAPLDLDDAREAFILPVLRHLHAERIYSEGFPFERLAPGSSSLARVELVRCHLQPADFLEILGATSALAELRFSYEPVCSLPASTGLNAALALVARTLRSLWIGYPHGDIDKPAKYLGPLDGLRALETLMLSLPTEDAAPFDAWPVRRTGLPLSLRRARLDCAWKVEAGDEALGEFVSQLVRHPGVRAVELVRVFARWYDPGMENGAGKGGPRTKCVYVGAFPMGVKPGGGMLRIHPAESLRDAVVMAGRKGVRVGFEEVEGEEVGVWVSKKYTKEYTLEVDPDPFGRFAETKRVGKETFWKMREVSGG